MEEKINIKIIIQPMLAEHFEVKRITNRYLLLSLITNENNNTEKHDSRLGLFWVFKLIETTWHTHIRVQTTPGLQS